MKIIIVGGVAGGATAAARIRRLNEKAKIILIEKGAYISYANCGLPYHISGIIPDRNKLLLQTPKSFQKRYRVEVRVNEEALRIDTQSSKIRIRRMDGSEYEERYDKLLLSPGASPLTPPIKGIDTEGVFTLRDIPNLDAIISHIEVNKPKRAVIVGGGYIGLEVAENLRERGIFVNIIELAPQLFPTVDSDIAAIIHTHLKDKAVGVRLNKKLLEIEKKQNEIILRLENGNSILADMVIIAAGARPDVFLATISGIKTGKRGGIQTNKYLQTSDKNIYAVGDAIEVADTLIGGARLAPLAGPANKQARIAANNIVLGRKEKYEGTVGTSIAKVFDLAAGSCGYTSRLLRDKDIPFKSVVIHSASNANYYPGASPLTIKLLFNPDSGLIYGAQAVGISGVDKALDTISFALMNRMTVNDLSEHEQAYAPPFSSAKSPVNMVGFAARNIVEGIVENISAEDLLNSDIEQAVILDVRTKAEVALGKFRNAINIPVDELRDRIKEVPSAKKIYLYCGVGIRSYIAYRILVQNNFTEVYNISGGYRTLAQMDSPQENIISFENFTKQALAPKQS